MSEPDVFTVPVNGHDMRVWRKGNGPKIGFLAGYGGLPRWIPFLDALAKTHEVIVPSLPGFPGGGHAHLALDNHLDWVIATHELLAKAGLGGADLVGSSVGGSLAAEVAAIWPESVRRLVLIAPFGLYDDAEPPTDPWAQKVNQIPGLLAADAEKAKALRAPPEGANTAEWPIEMRRADEAAARLFWPLTNTRLEKRLPRVKAPTLLLWGEQDRIMPRRYAAQIKSLIPGGAELTLIPGAGHLAELDQPDAVAAAISGWTKA